MRDIQPAREATQGETLRVDPSADPSYRDARVFVTGATGLIGTWLTRALLDAGAEVSVFTLPEPEPDSDLVRRGDIKRTRVHVGRLEDRDSLLRAVREASPDVVFHLGAQTLVGVARADPEHTLFVNVAGTWTLLEACRRLAKPPRAIAVASSDKAYGRSDHLPYVETDALAAEEPYEASKAAADILARSYGVAYGLSTRIARCGNVYGAGDAHWSRLVPGTIRSLLAGERPVLRSDGLFVRDYIHVEDVVAGYLALGTADVRPGEAFNFSSAERLTVLEVVRMANEAIGTNIQPLIKSEALGEIREQYLDSSKARRVLGWAATRRMRQSLPKIVEWYREFLLASGDNLKSVS